MEPCPFDQPLARASRLSVAPTVTAAGVEEGEYEQASALLLPAATTQVTPEATEASTASLTDWVRPPPMLMLATEGPSAFLVTQSMPARTGAQVLPEVPWQLSTRTPTSRTAFATPCEAPPTVPATWVPWPWQSEALESSSMKS